MTNFRNSYSNDIESKVGLRGRYGLKVRGCGNKSAASRYDFIFRIKGSSCEQVFLKAEKNNGTLLTFAHITGQRIKSEGQEQDMSLKELLRLEGSPAFVFKIMGATWECRRGFKPVESYIVTESVRDPPGRSI